MPAPKGISTARCTVSGVVNLDLTTGSGDITIKAGGSTRSSCMARFSSNSWFSNAENAVHQVESNPPIQQNGNSIRIGYNLPEDVKRHVSISYEVTVPADAAVQAHSGSGGIGVEGVRGEVQATDRLGRHPAARSGRPRACPDRKRRDSRAGCRRPRSTPTPAAAILKPSSTARAMWISKPVRAAFTCAASKADCTRVPAAANISAEGSVTGGWQLHTGSGYVHLAVGSGSGFNLDVHTGSGSIHSDLPITVQGSMGQHELKGAVRGGGPEVEVSTGSGDVEIR